MKHFNPETKTFKVFQALQSGKTLTASQAAKLGVKNLSAEVSHIRQNGFAVYTNTRKAGNGVQVTEYVLGKPSRKLVALGYKAMSMGITLYYSLKSRVRCLDQTKHPVNTRALGPFFYGWPEIANLL